MSNQFKKVIAMVAAALTMTQFAGLSQTAFAAEDSDALTSEVTASSETEETTEASSEETTEASIEETTEASAEVPTEAISEIPADAQGAPDFSYLGAIGTLSEEQTAMIASSIYNALKNHETRIVFDTVNYERIQKDRDLDSLSRIFYTVLYSTRYGILANQGFSYAYSMPADQPYYITALVISYSVPDELYADAFADVEQKLDAILQGVDTDWSAPEKALYLHDYFAVNFNYDYEGLANAAGGDPCFTAYGLLIENVAVCQGYAWLYNVLLSELDIECYVVTSDENYHAWNAVVLDGMYYNVDCTYDDNMQLGTAQLGLAGQVSHTSFLKSHAAMISSGHKCNAYDWVLSNGRTFWTVDANGSYVVNVPTDNKYNNGFWTTTHSAIYPLQDGWLVKEPDPFNAGASSYNLYTYDFESNSAEWVSQIASEDSEWFASLDRTRCYSDNYSVCCVKDDIVYFTTNSGVMAAVRDENNGQYAYTPVALFALDDEQAQNGFVYGMRISGDMMYFQVVPDLRTAPVEYKYSVAGAIDIINLAAHSIDEDPAEMTGDLNGDNLVDILDVISMQRYLAGEDTLDDLNARRHADIVEDGVLDIFDLAMLKKIVLSQA